MCDGGRGGKMPTVMHAIRHRFCAHCGCAPFDEGVNPKAGEANAAVKVRCLPDLDLAALKVIPCDGAGS